MSFFNFQIVSPTFLTSIQLDEIVAIAVQAYDTNPTICAMTGGNKALYDPFLRVVTRALLREGKVWLAVLDGKILGVLGGFGPGTFLWATEEQRALGFNYAYARLTEETKYWWQNIYGPQIKEFVDNALGETVSRHGIATAMFKEMTQQAIQDKAIMIVGADSDLNVGIYESFGFKFKGRTVLPSSVKGESQPLFALKKIP
ncbi:uncharacterized protein BT62DRAFT_996005, partial [Guyanagaster necrorhizus]